MNVILEQRKPLQGKGEYKKDNYLTSLAYLTSSVEGKQHESTRENHIKKTRRRVKPDETKILFKKSVCSADNAIRSLRILTNSDKDDDSINHPFFVDELPGKISSTPCTSISSSNISIRSEVTKKHSTSTEQYPRIQNTNTRLDDFAIDVDFNSVSEQYVSELDESLGSPRSQSRGRKVDLRRYRQHNFLQDEETLEEQLVALNQTDDGREIEIEFSEWNIEDLESLDGFCPVPNEITTILDQRFEEEIRIFKLEKEILKRELEIQKEKDKEKKEIMLMQKKIKELHAKVDFERRRMENEKEKVSRSASKNRKCWTVYLTSLIVLFVCGFSSFPDDTSVLRMKSNEVLRTINEGRLAKIQHRYKITLERKTEMQSSFEKSKIKNTVSKYNDAKPMDVCGCDEEENDELNSMQEGTLMQTHGGKHNKLVAMNTNARDYSTIRQYPWLNKREQTVVSTKKVKDSLKLQNKLGQSPTNTKQKKHWTARAIENILRPTAQRNSITSEESVWLNFKPKKINPII